LLAFDAPTFVDADGDGLPDHRVPKDAQWFDPGDGYAGEPRELRMLRKLEASIDLNQDGIPDIGVTEDSAWFVDSDGDGLPDRRVPTPLPTRAPAR